MDLVQKPKIDSAYRVPDYYNFLGPLLLYNTSVYEATLKPAKALGKKGNNKLEQVSKTIVVKVSHAQQVFLLFLAHSV